MTAGHALIIDDNAENIGVLAELLALEGMSATKLLQASQLSKVLSTLDSVEVIFLDLEMPGMNGYQALQLIKADARLKAVPVVAYTVHLSEINTARQIGFNSFLAKPLDADRFPDRLTRILRGEGVWTTS